MLRTTVRLAIVVPRTMLCMVVELQKEWGVAAFKLPPVGTASGLRGRDGCRDVGVVLCLVWPRVEMSARWRSTSQPLSFLLSSTSAQAQWLRLYTLLLGSPPKDTRRHWTRGISQGMVEAPFKVDRDVVAALRNAVRDCSDRGLLCSSKWFVPSLSICEIHLTRTEGRRSSCLRYPSQRGALNQRLWRRCITSTPPPLRDQDHPARPYRS